jgi:putative DNA primase/helicase
MTIERRTTTIDRSQIEQFIKFLTGDIDSPIHWQWYDDQKKGRVYPGHCYGTIAEKWDDLVSLNEQGAGIFVTINDTDGAGRKNEDIQSIRCVFADMDGPPLDVLKDSPIKFHLLVQSSPDRYHAYLRIKDLPVTDDNREEMSDLLEAVQKGMAEKFGSDTSVSNLNQVMRCPGFFHQKKEPFLSKIIAANPSPPLNVSEVIEKFHIDLTKPVDKPDDPYNPDDKLKEGQGRRQHLFKYACGAVSRGLTDHEVEILTAYRNLEICDEPLMEDELQEVMKYANKYEAEYGLSGKEFKPKLFADGILKRWKVFNLGGQHYRYEDKDGYYQPWDDVRIKKTVLDWSNGNATVSQMENLVKRLEIETAADPEEVNPVGWLNTLSGIMNPETGEIVPHTPDLKFTIQLPVGCENLPAGDNPRPPQCNLFNRFLEDVLPDPAQRDAAWEILGYCLTTDCRLEIAIILYGGGSNGKTVFLNILRAMLRGLVSELRLSDLSHSYRPAMLLNKLVNISGEGEAVDLIDDAVVKSLISGEPMAVEQKYKDPVVIKPFCKLIIATNHLPRSRDKSRGYFRRWLILHFDQEIAEDRQDKQLSQKIIDSELDEIFYGALLGLQRLRKQNGFTVPESSKALLGEYEKMTNPAIMFIEEHLAVVPEGSEYLQDIYYKYASWCEKQGHKNALNQPNLRREIEKRTGKDLVRLTGGKTGFKGLVLTEAQRLREITEGMKKSGGSSGADPR